MNLIKLSKIFTIMFLSVIGSSCWANDENIFSDQQITTDVRIKTLIHNPNHVYRMSVRSGFQSTIEFAEGEEITTISIGDTYSWKLTPVNNRIFIKPMEQDILTNMTVITNKRIYHFDLVSVKFDKDNADIVYVMRFFYPE